MIVPSCPWYIAGPLLGLLIVALRAAVNRPLGALGGYIDLTEHVGRPRDLTFSSFLLFGIVCGGFLFALATGTFSPTFAYDPGNAVLSAARSAWMPVLVLAGIAMGLGARTAGGCTSGHGLCGVSLGSPGSLVATANFFATAVALAHLLAWIFGGTR
jgi:hypothetical protein